MENFYVVMGTFKGQGSVNMKVFDSFNNSPLSLDEARWLKKSREASGAYEACYIAKLALVEDVVAEYVEN